MEIKTTMDSIKSGVPAEVPPVDDKSTNRSIISPKVSDRIASAFLWGFAGLTIGILLFILGFILYHGFVSDNLIETKVIPSTSKTVMVPWMDEPALIIANKGLKLTDLQVQDLIDLFAGSPSNWGNLTEQDISVQLIGLQSVPIQGEVWKFGKKITLKKDEAELIKTVEELPGAVGFLPASQAVLLKDSKVSNLNIWDMSLAVNPSVLAVENNIKIRFMNKELISRIISGDIQNWNEVGGVDLPIVFILPPEGSSGHTLLVDIKMPSGSGNIIPVSSLAEQQQLIESTPGAVGIYPYLNAKGLNLPILSYQSRHRGRNIQMSFILEPPKRAGRVGGISSIIVNTIYMVILTILFSTPIGVGAAIYLVEYANQGRLVKVLRLGTETLAGIPSIIFGLFGFIVFVGLFKLGIGLLSGTLTITLMILPTIVRTAEEALKSVPKSFREGSLALGAGKWMTIYRVVLPAAAPGIVTGVVLGVGRAIGETAALLFTMGFDYRRAESLFTSSRVLSVHLYQLVKEGISFDRAFATATILIIIILGTNLLMNSRIFRKRY
ncbi:MAG: phosphate ABC transporter permease PstA [Spirochaetales bacterium]|nr:phosphate ABC transporter permease PstA [Spirochaetales bacterium]